jgi:hypothetical protein
MTKIIKNKNTVETEFREAVADTFRWCTVPFEFSYGWDVLVAEMLDEIEAKVLELGLTTEYVQLTELEDRYGTLKVSGVWPAEVDPIIERYTDQSTRICRTCGKPGKLLVGAGVFWYASCEEHRLPNSVTGEEFANEQQPTLRFDNEPL